MLRIAVTGPDGSGKSTACAAARALLEARLGAGAVAEVSVWDALRPKGSPFSRKEEAEAYLADLDGPSRTLFIFHALSRSHQLAERSGARVLLLNGWWYKYAASEIAYGVDPAFVLGAARGFAVPDRVLYLDVGAEEAWARKQAASAYESGGKSSPEKFLKFQRALREGFGAVERGAAGPAWERLSALAPPEALARAVAEAGA